MPTTTSITAVNVSILSDQSTCNAPEVNQLPISETVAGAVPRATWMKTIQDNSAETNKRLVVTISEGRAPIRQPKGPAIKNPKSGRKTIAAYMSRSALHHVDVVDRDNDPRLR